MNATLLINVTIHCHQILSELNRRNVWIMFLECPVNGCLSPRVWRAHCGNRSLRQKRLRLYSREQGSCYRQFMSSKVSSRDPLIIPDVFQRQPKQCHLGAKHSIIKLRMGHIPCSKCTGILQRGTHIVYNACKVPLCQMFSAELLKVLIKEAEGCFPICALQMCHHQQRTIATSN